MHGNDTAHGEIFQTATRLAAMALSSEWPTIGDLRLSAGSPKGLIGELGLIGHPSFCCLIWTLPRECFEWIIVDC